MRRPIVVLTLSVAMMLAACGGSIGGSASPSPSHTAGSPPVVAPSPSVSPGGGGSGGDPDADPSCEREGSVRSISGDQSMDLEFVNRTSVPIQAFWLDYEGKRVFYQKIQAGQSAPQPTFETHPWVLADLDGTCLLLVVAAEGVRRVEVGP